MIYDLDEQQFVDVDISDNPNPVTKYVYMDLNNDTRKFTTTTEPTVQRSRFTPNGGSYDTTPPDYTTIGTNWIETNASENTTNFIEDSANYVYKKIQNNNINFIITLKKLADTVTNEDRSDIIDIKFAKCRANKLLVIDIEKLDTLTFETCSILNVASCTNFTHNKITRYQIGNIVYPDAYDVNINNIHTTGIHYFNSKRCAIMYEVSSLLDGMYESWYDNGQLKEQCEHFFGAKIGPYISFYDNGQIYIKCIYMNGKIEGFYTSFYPNGEKMIKCFYFNDDLNGLYESWYDDGKLNITCIYTNDMISSLFTSRYRSGIIACNITYHNNVYNGSYETWYDTVSEVAEQTYKRPSACVKCSYVGGRKHGLYKEWYKNGSVHKMCTYNEGKPHGKYEIFYANGNKKVRCIHVNGQIDGIRYLYYSNGKLESEIEYTDGNMNGVYRAYYDNTDQNLLLKCHSYYSNGKLHGFYSTWYASGKVCIKCSYKSDKFNGEYNTWYENGRRRSNCTYRDGKVIGKFISWTQSGELKFLKPQPLDQEINKYNINNPPLLDILTGGDDINDHGVRFVAIADDNNNI
jgi:antitoxin component YwqK of YwqJK toxin-antitoxin module